MAKLRYVIAYTENTFHTTNYETMFTDIRDSQRVLNSAVWHIGAKCIDAPFAISSIELQQCVDNKWATYGEVN